MVKKCEQCGAPAVDAQSVFCNLCGGYVQDEPGTVLPVCRACGIPAPDDQSVFCTRCGLKFASEPDDRYPVCISCGSVIPDDQAVFCNRCGTRISPGQNPVAVSGAPVAGDPALRSTPRKGRPAPADNMKIKTPGSVIITRKKHPANQPVQVGGYVPDVLPLSLDPAEDSSEEAPPDLLVADERTGDTSPTKKYAHLPLVAEELKVKDSPGGGFFSNGAREPATSHRKKQSPKNGIMGMFRR